MTTLDVARALADELDALDAWRLELELDDVIEDEEE
jgi:hypothetical protein